MPNKKTIILTDADGLAENSLPAVLILQISRNEIEALNYTSSLERLMVMADSRENTIRYRESLLIQIAGYDSDPRELAEIPEVRRFFARLVNEWPHWLWFLSREQGTISLFLSLICKIKIHRAQGTYGLEFVQPAELSARIDELLTRGIALFEAFNISPEDAEMSAKSALAAMRMS